METQPAEGLVYIIATGGERPIEEARRLAARLREAARAPESGPEEREVPGAVWGFIPFAPGGWNGDRLTHARRGTRQAVLRGDPVWLEPLNARPSTAEELLRLWEEEGGRAAARLDNLSLAVVADPERGEIALATDRMGGISLYEAEIAGMRVFSTSYIALSRIVESQEIDGDSLAAFFHLGFFPGRRTALAAIHLHPCASLTRIRGGKVVTEPYWKPCVTIDRSRSEREQLDGAIEAFNASVREYSIGREAMYLAMTAGFDSRSIASSLIRQRIPFEAYTHGFPGCWEGKRVQSIVERHRIPHRFVPLEGPFVDRLYELALRSFHASEGTISCIEKSHLFHVLSQLREAAPAAGLLLGGGAGMLKGTYYRLLRDEDPCTPRGVEGYLKWNFSKRLPDLFAPEVAACDRRILREFVTSTLDEVEGGTLFQKLDYLYAVRYRRWAGGVKCIYRRFFPTREPFVSARMLECLFPLDPRVKGAQRPHFAILASNYPAIQYDLTNKMTPALPFKLTNLHRFLPSVAWRAKQVLRGFSRRYLPRELFPLADYVDYKTWIRSAGGRALVDDLLGPGAMKSAHLYDERRLRAWIDEQKRTGYGAFALLDKMCTLELYFREIQRS